MIDTANMIQPHELFETGLMPDWKSTSSVAQSDEGQIREFYLRHLPTKYFTKGKNGYTLFHTASLPRLVFGDNGKLIKNQEQLDAGLNLLFAKAAEIGRPTTDKFHFTRVDLVWQFQVDVPLFIQAHRNSRHSRIRIDPRLYEKRSLMFKGSEVKIRMYDKVREKFKRDGNILRVEVELHGRRLMEELGGGEQVTSLNFDLCYQAYRRVMLGFEQSPIPRKSNIAGLLAAGMRAGWTIGGVPVFEWHTMDMSTRHISRLRRQVEALRPTFYQIDWGQLLPADGPPPAIEI
jgi:hypothetical protein